MEQGGCMQQRRVHKSCPEWWSVNKTWDEEVAMQFRNALTHTSYCSGDVCITHGENGCTKQTQREGRGACRKHGVETKQAKKKIYRTKGFAIGAGAFRGGSVCVRHGASKK
eukprot:scaffold5897_cov188-Skeletonema_dohrnii-CCMP3373.AAC.1